MDGPYPAACLVIMGDWPFEKVQETHPACGALHEWTMVACNVRRTHNAIARLRADLESTDHILAAAGWDIVPGNK